VRLDFAEVVSDARIGEFFQSGNDRVESPPMDVLSEGGGATYIALDETK
jgi:hypothetical protein